MMETSEGHVKSASEEVTPVGNFGDGAEGGAAAPPHVGVEQLEARK